MVVGNNSKGNQSNGDILFLVTSGANDNEIKSHDDDVLGLVEGNTLFYRAVFMKHLGDFPSSLDSS